MRFQRLLGRKAILICDSDGLVDNVGNLLNRVVSLVHKYYNGTIPPYVHGVELTPVCNITSREDLNLYLLNKFNTIVKFVDNFEPKKALEVILEVSSTGNNLLQANKPWELYKEESNSPVIKSILHAELQILAVVGTLLHPFIPFFC